MALASLTIANTSENPIIVIHEPEGFEFHLPINEEIIIETDAVSKVSSSINLLKIIKL